MRRFLLAMALALMPSTLFAQGTPADSAHAKRQHDSLTVVKARIDTLSKNYGCNPTKPTSVTCKLLARASAMVPGMLRAESTLAVAPTPPAPTQPIAVIPATGTTILTSDSTTWVNGKPSRYVSPINAVWTEQIPNARWIWKTPVVANPTVADTGTFTKLFSLSVLPVSETVDLSSDDGYRLIVNGHLISDSLGIVQPTYARADHYVIPASALVVGTNTLTVLVRNNPSPTDTNPLDNPAGLMYALTASYVVAPPPPPPPAPTDSTEPVFSTATGTLMAADSIDQYTSAHAMWTSTASGPRFVQAQNTGTEDPDSTLLMNGGHANPNGKYLRLVYGGDVAGQDARAWYFVGTPTLPNTTTHYFSYWGRVTFASSIATTSVGLKWFMFYHTNGDRIQWALHDNLPCKLWPKNPDGSVAEYTYWQIADGSLTACQGNQPVGPFPADVFNGQWHRFTYQYKANSAPGSRDGFARMWVDGVKVIDVSQATVGVTPPGGYKTWCDQSDVDALSSDTSNTLDFGSVLTTGTPPFTLDIDDFLWWTGK